MGKDFKTCKYIKGWCWKCMTTTAQKVTERSPYTQSAKVYMNCDCTICNTRNINVAVWINNIIE